MHSFLRILQITLIITQITTVKGSSSSTATPPEPSMTSVLVPASTELSTKATNVPDTSTVTIDVAATSSEPLKTSSVSGNATPPEPPMTSVLVTASTELSTKATNVPDTPTVTIDVAATSSEPVAQKGGTSAELWPSPSQKNNVATKSSTSVLVAASTELSTQANNVSGASTRTNFSQTGPFTPQTQSMTANYLLSSASRRGSIALTTAEPTATRSSSIVQTLTTSLPVSVNWTDWSVDSDHCQEYCSEKGGTVTASRQCYSHAVTLADEVCTKHNTSTKVVECNKHCPLSGKEAFRSSISTLAVSILLIMLSSTFVRG